MDLAVGLSLLLRAPLAYFVHTQRAGLVGTTSDSIWRFAGPLHGALERRVVRRAQSVIVFNPEHARELVPLNPTTTFLPTWYDPDLLRSGRGDRDPFRLVWVGRVEAPKDPLLAVAAFARLAGDDPRWTLELLGSGSLLEEVRQAVAALPDGVAGRVAVRGRVEPAAVYDTLARSGVFLMTSHPGYEGFPMVLVEAMASGLPAVVTAGADTGGLVEDGTTGYTTSRDPAGIAARIAEAGRLDRGVVVARVRGHSAPELVEQVFTSTLGQRKVH